MLAGSTKKDQRKTITQAKKYLADYDRKDKTMTKKASRSFDKTSKELLKDPKVAAMYLEEILTDGDMELFMAALKDVADARVGSMTALSKQTHLNREQLYKTLSNKGNPRLETLTKVLHAMGLRISVTPEITPASH